MNFTSKIFLFAVVLTLALFPGRADAQPVMSVAGTPMPADVSPQHFSFSIHILVAVKEIEPIVHAPGGIRVPVKGVIDQIYQNAPAWRVAAVISEPVEFDVSCGNLLPDNPPCEPFETATHIEIWGDFENGSINILRVYKAEPR
jgi:hypothetical protein